MDTFKFKVEYWQKNFGSFTIMAKDKAEAKAIAEELDDKSDLFKSEGTEYSIGEIDEIKG